MSLNMFYYYKTRWLRNKLFKNYTIRPDLGIEHSKKCFKEFYGIRKPLIKTIIDDYNVRNKTILDLCSGVGQDDILFSEFGDNKVVSVETSKTSCDYHKEMIKKYAVDNEVHNCNMMRFRYKDKFDVVFTANSGNWTNESTEIGIPSYFLKVVKRHSKDGTIFICVLNSGNYHFVTDKEVENYMKLFKNKILSINFNVLDYKRVNNTNKDGLLIVSSKSKLKGSEKK